MGGYQCPKLKLSSMIEPYGHLDLFLENKNKNKKEKNRAHDSMVGNFLFRI